MILKFHQSSTEVIIFMKGLLKLREHLDLIPKATAEEMLFQSMRGFARHFLRSNKNLCQDKILSAVNAHYNTELIRDPDIFQLIVQVELSEEYQRDCNKLINESIFIDSDIKNLQCIDRLNTNEFKSEMKDIIDSQYVDIRLIREDDVSCDFNFVRKLYLQFILSPVLVFFANNPDTSEPIIKISPQTDYLFDAKLLAQKYMECVKFYSLTRPLVENHLTESDTEIEAKIESERQLAETDWIKYILTVLTKRRHELNLSIKIVYLNQLVQSNYDPNKPFKYLFDPFLFSELYMIDNDDYYKCTHPEIQTKVNQALGADGMIFHFDENCVMSLSFVPSKLSNSGKFNQMLLNIDSIEIQNYRKTFESNLNEHQHEILQFLGDQRYDVIQSIKDLLKLKDGRMIDTGINKPAPGTFLKIKLPLENKWRCNKILPNDSKQLLTPEMKNQINNILGLVDFEYDISYISFVGDPYEKLYYNLSESYINYLNNFSAYLEIIPPKYLIEPSSSAKHHGCLNTL